tara:strand:- start:115288 stop:115692 length:405 start_codon:yes stop_codon:yes gene_type:complete
MPLYENTFIARPDVSSQQVEALGEQFNESIRESGGEVTTIEQWGLRNLAYKIKKNRKGYYVHMRISATAEAISEMERNMRLNEDIIRFLTIKVEALDTNPSAMMQSRPREVKADSSVTEDHNYEDLDNQLKDNE